jgi:hypothetical protein
VYPFETMGCGQSRLELQSDGTIVETISPKNSRRYAQASLSD